MSQLSPLQSDFHGPEKLATIDQEDVETQQALSVLWTVFPDLKLSNIQVIVFVESWKGKTYQQIAESEQYDADYLKDVGHRLWKQLSESSQETFSKHNFRSILKHQLQRIGSVQPFFKPMAGNNGVVLSPSKTVLNPLAHRPIVDLREVIDLPVFVGRSTELLKLEQQIIHDKNRLIGIFGLGGVGKTTLVMRLIQKIETRFEFVIGRSLRNTPDFESFLRSVLQTIQGDAFADTPARLEDQVELLIDKLSRRRCLLFVGDWLSLLQSQSSLRAYRTQYEYYGLLLRRISESRHQSCLIITSRETPNGLAFKDNESFPVSSLYLKGFNQDEGLMFLRTMNLVATDYELEKLWWFYAGNPYALKVVSKTIINLFDGNVAEFLSKNNMIYGDIRRLIEQQFHRLSDFEKAVMYHLSLMSENGEPELMSKELERKFSSSKKQENSLIEALESLYHRSFIQRKGKTIVLPQILREYILCFHQNQEAIRTSEA
jgi:hypothetical protein